MSYPHTTTSYNLRGRVAGCECGATAHFLTHDVPKMWGNDCPVAMHRHIDRLENPDPPKHQHASRRAITKSARSRINRFLNLSSAPLLLSAVSWGGDPSKEITESLAVYDAMVRASAGVPLSKPGVSVLVVGDGVSPRTGALVACMSRWDVTSIDPKAHREGPHPEIQRLVVVRDYLERRPDLRADFVLAVHSHATVKATMDACKPGGVVVLLPCCVPWPRMEGDEVYEDEACLSPQRRIIIRRVPA